MEKFSPEKFGFSTFGGGWELDKRKHVRLHYVKKYEDGTELERIGKSWKEGKYYKLKPNGDLLILECDDCNEGGSISDVLFQGKIDTNEFAELLFKNTGVIE